MKIKNIWNHHLDYYFREIPQKYHIFAIKFHDPPKLGWLEVVATNPSQKYEPQIGNHPQLEVNIKIHFPKTNIFAPKMMVSNRNLLFQGVYFQVHLLLVSGRVFELPPPSGSFSCRPWVSPHENHVLTNQPMMDEKRLGYSCWNLTSKWKSPAMFTAEPHLPSINQYFKLFGNWPHNLHIGITLPKKLTHLVKSYRFCSSPNMATSSFNIIHMLKKKYIHLHSWSIFTVMLLYTGEKQHLFDETVRFSQVSIQRGPGHNKKRGVRSCCVMSGDYILTKTQVFFCQCINLKYAPKANGGDLSYSANKIFLQFLLSSLKVR